MQVTLGGSPDSWGVWAPTATGQVPWNRFLDEVTQAGYHTIELGPYGYLPTDPSLLRDELAKRGLSAASSFITRHLENEDAWALLREDIDRSGALLAALGARFMVLIDETYNDLFTGERVAPVTLDPDAWKRLVATIGRGTQYAKERWDLQLVFHPHAESHVETEEQIERLLAEDMAAQVSLCLDLGHHAYRGGDPVAFYRKFAERIPYLHFKSVDGVRLRSANQAGMSFNEAVKSGVFVEPQRGTVDFAGLRDALVETEYVGYGIVEQDMIGDFVGKDAEKPLELATATALWFRELGLA